MEDRGLKIEIEDIAGLEKAKLIKMLGVLDTVTTEEADKMMAPLIKETELSLIILDCGKLRYMNSTGLANLIKYYIQLKRRGSSFKLINLTKFVHEILDISGAVKLLEIYRTQEEAISSWTNK